MAKRSCTLCFGPNRDRLCEWDGKPLPERCTRWCSTKCGDTYWANHGWTDARRAARARDKYACVRCGLRRAEGAKLEVDHITPVMGKHSLNGCWHHLDGLRTLCHECHLDETNRQFKRGKYRSEERRVGKEC